MQSEVSKKWVNQTQYQSRAHCLQHVWSLSPCGGLLVVSTAWIGGLEWQQKIQFVLIKLEVVHILCLILSKQTDMWESRFNKSVIMQIKHHVYLYIISVDMEEL